MAALSRAMSPRVRIALFAACAAALPFAAAVLWHRAGPPAASAELARAEKEAPHDLREAVEALEKRLAASPNDVDGWAMLARSYTMLGEQKKAADASARIAELRARDPGRLARQAEEMIAQAGGMVSPEARRLIAASLALDPKDARARFFTGLARAQEGDGAAALEIWLALAADTPQEAPWREGLEANIARLAEETGTGAEQLAALRRAAETRRGG